MKESLALPTQICVNVVAFLGKPNGAGERPITPTGCPYAVYMARYKNETRRWDDVYHGWWDDAVKGNSALQSGLLRRIYEEVATLNGQQSACSAIWKSSLTVCVCTNSSIRHWSGTFQNDCSTLLCKRISASESSVQGKWWSKAYSLAVAYWLAAPWETGLRGWYFTTFWNVVNNALPAQLLAPVETRQFVDELTTVSAANSEDDVALELRDELQNVKLAFQWRTQRETWALMRLAEAGDDARPVTKDIAQQDIGEKR